MIKNVVFDIGNVLVEFGWKPFFQKFGITDEELDRIAKATVYAPIWNEIDRGVMSEEEILDKFIENDPGMEEKMREIYADFNGLLKIFDYTRGWIIDLKRRGYKVYCLSNMSFKAVRECWDALSFIEETDGYILSCDVKLTKPEPEIYEALFKKYNLKPEECVFFDDVQKNIDGANKAGMHAFLFTSVKQAEEDLASVVKVEGFTSSYTKGQRIASVVCLCLIAVLFVAMLVLSFFKTPLAKTLFKVTLGAALILPILTWIYIWLIGKLTRKRTIADFKWFENDK
ncbi:MAG: HAD family phosphatase [Lachnospiraceae bacterium]|nr:HAD family phosphatase [Lachnospiraceae bacterium]